MFLILKCFLKDPSTCALFGLLPGMAHPQLLWANSPMPHLAHSEECLPNMQSKMKYY